MPRAAWHGRDPGGLATTTMLSDQPCKILRPVVVPYLGSLGDATFLEDNPSWSDLPRDKYFDRMLPWHTSSPDLSLLLMG
ncbi:hypothetical protein TNCV_1748071 [Trichonephila clavipes]|nr:hypothetical protein TNCV_1748071 [Trichonephila clavipes]